MVNYVNLFSKEKIRINHLIARFNSFMTEASIILETNPLVCSANQRTVFFMIGTSVMKELRLLSLRNSNFKNLVFEAQLKTFLFHGKIMFGS